MKVTITGMKVCQNQDGKPFIALELQGDIIVSQSENGNYYLTAKKCTIPSSFPEEIAKTLIGQEIPGMIEKVACAPFDYKVKETGEVISLNYRWEYRPIEKPAALKVVDLVGEDLAA